MSAITVVIIAVIAIAIILLANLDTMRADERCCRVGCIRHLAGRIAYAQVVLEVNPVFGSC
eukprot:10155932-Lingulodinium_polyedra.AAC.1